jgi:aryl-alcohol dehydrogenase-like predicted oxidoreductase
MKYRSLGQSGLKVPVVCLGTMTFGEADEKSFMHQVGCDERTAFAIMDRAVDAGATFFDTADVYGRDGLTERVIGKWFAEHGKRNEVLLATKFRFRMGDGPNGTGASRYRIVRAVEDSLRRLRTDHVELYQIHMQDVEVPEEETLRALDDLVRAGKVLYVGCSNYTGYRLTDSLWTSRTQHLTRFVSLQAHWNLLERGLERELLPTCEKFGLGILPWSPLAGGLLTGKYTRDNRPEGARLHKWEDRWNRQNNDRTWRVLDALAQVSRETGASQAAIALAWLLAKPIVSSVIIGARTVAQLDQNLEAAALELAPAHLAALDEASRFEPGYPYDFIQRIQGRW